jgi:hypothetical protein
LPAGPLIDRDRTEKSAIGIHLWGRAPDDATVDTRDESGFEMSDQIVAGQPTSRKKLQNRRSVLDRRAFDTN